LYWGDFLDVKSSYLGDITPLNIVDRNDIYIAHNGEERAVIAPDTEVFVEKCAKDLFHMGNSVCLKGFHQKLEWGPDKPLPFVSGPVHLDLVAKPVDKSVHNHFNLFS
jgi:hypothetical protein